MIYFFILIVAFISWLIGTTTAGGASIIFLLILSMFFPIATLPLLIAVVGTFAGIYRTYVYRHFVYWPIIKWLLPGTIIGSVTGASIFLLLLSQETIKIFEFFLGFILILSGTLGTYNKQALQVKFKNWCFLPAGIITATISGVIGGAPPIINLLYQKFTLTPCQILGTKSINLFVLQVTKCIIYFSFLSFYFYHGTKLIPESKFNSPIEIFSIGVFASIGAAMGISLSKRILKYINFENFKIIMNFMLILFGLYFIFKTIYY